MLCLFALRQEGILTNFGDAGSLISNLGMSIGITLDLDEQGEAAIECGNGVIVRFTAAPAAQAILLEGRRSHPVLPDSPDALLQVLALNRSAGMVAAHLALDREARTLCTRQFVPVAGLTTKIFANVVNAFVDSTVFAFREVEGLLRGGEAGPAETQGWDEEMVVLRG